MTASQWTPIEMVDAAARNRSLCFPLASIHVNRAGKIFQVIRLYLEPVFLEASWTIVQGDPIRRGLALEEGFIGSLIEDLSDENEPEDSEDSEDSGLDENLTKLKSPVEDGSMNWITRILEWSEDRDRQEILDQKVNTYVLLLYKNFNCSQQNCVEHADWTVTVKRSEGFKTFEDLKQEENMLELIEKWIQSLKDKILPSVQDLNFISTVLGRR